MSEHETSTMVCYHLIVSFYKSLLNQNKLTEKQYEKACRGLAKDMKIKECVF